MTFRMRNRVRECKPLPMFEELEQRIVLDATVDSDVSHASYGWDLEYASNPSSSVAPVIDASDLADYQGTLIDNTPTIDMDPTAAFTGSGPFTITWPDGSAIVGANDADQLDVGLLVHHGNLTFSPALPSGVTTVTNTQGVTTGDTEIYLRGPQTLLNYSLNNLQYTPYAYGLAAPYDHFTGSDTLTVSVMDNGSHLANRDPVERTREQTLQITVNP